MAKSKTYSLTAKINGETVRRFTDDLNQTIKDLKPDWLHTEVYITVKKGKQIAERRLTLTNAKRVFVNDINREVFINNLMLT
jgi:hypothetical protein